MPQDLSATRSGNIDLINQLFGFGQQGAGQGIGGQNVTDRLQNIFGNLAPAGYAQFLNQKSPQEQALNTAMPSLQEILTPGANNPALDRDLALAPCPRSRRAFST